MPVIPVFDGHNDTLLHLYEKSRGGGRSFFAESAVGHIDLPRARKGGFAGGFFAIFVPTPSPEALPPAASEQEKVARFLDAGSVHVERSFALEKTLGMVRLMYDLERESRGEVRIVRSLMDLLRCLDEGALAMIFHIEGAEVIDPDLDALYVLHAAGLRSLGLVWSRPNDFGHGVPFTFPGTPDTGPGLSEVGRTLVKACNTLGVLVDLSHLNEKGFWEVASLSDRPLVATHSGVHALCASPRNLTDRQLDAIRESRGVVGINFHVGFLRQDGANEAETPMQEIVRHIEYAVNRIGIDHVALGSDFDGALMPRELGDVTGLPRLMQALAQQGFDAESLHKIALGNWMRVLEETWLSP
jgi:membrane dipeptidase